MGLKRYVTVDEREMLRGKGKDWDAEGWKWIKAERRTLKSLKRMLDVYVVLYVFSGVYTPLHVI